MRFVEVTEQNIADAGRFTEKNTTMLVSRGVGNSIVPIRINNRPEVVVAQLEN